MLITCVLEELGREHGAWIDLRGGYTLSQYLHLSLDTVLISPIIHIARLNGYPRFPILYKSKRGFGREASPSTVPRGFLPNAGSLCTLSSRKLRASH